MSDNRKTERRDEGPHIEAGAARGGEIILRTRRRRAIFIGGLIGFGVVAIVVAGLALL
ncbi:MAG: hypothetical protein V2I39_03540 [Erythrobacter sp.]|jgi:hypothetical protein|nr:hypothetical protein [Erythrobacter sp.]